MPLPLLSTPVLWDEGSTLITSFNLNHLLEGVHKYSHARGLAFDIKIFRGTQLIPSQKMKMSFSLFDKACENVAQC